VGSETVRFLAEKGLDVVGIDNDMRRYFFGDDASTASSAEQLRSDIKSFRHLSLDIRNREEVFKIFKEYGQRIALVVHAASQPSHDWAAREPFTDFSINAHGTLVTLEAVREYCPDATYIFTSTNKVYGDTPNRLPLVEHDTRWELDPEHNWVQHGIDESMSIDSCMHSLFGASKVAGDILVQEYGRYFGMKTGVFRCGCITGPAHAGAELHGFLAYLVRCAITKTPYTIFGYKGKQVRDNIHAQDLAEAFWHYHCNPKPSAVYNMGGSRFSDCSVLEAITLIEKLTGKSINHSYEDKARAGDHIWWISDVRRFQNDYPQWRYKYGLSSIVEQIIETAIHRESKV
jgi:CDP-paratose 2-epimerase